VRVPFAQHQDKLHERWLKDFERFFCEKARGNRDGVILVESFRTERPGRRRDLRIHQNLPHQRAGDLSPEGVVAW
jgi:hypothetical protein